MTTKIEQKVIQLQQELFTLKAQVAARVQIAAAVQARFNLLFRFFFLGGFF